MREHFSTNKNFNFAYFEFYNVGGGSGRKPSAIGPHSVSH